MASFTQAQLTALEDAIAQGAKIVKYSDKHVEYRSLDEMLKLRDLMRADLGVTDKARGGRVYPTFSKGLRSE